MRMILNIVFKAGVCLLFLPMFYVLNADQGEVLMANKSIVLPEPRYTGNISVEEAMNKRRSIRRYSNEGLTLQEVSQLLWACSGKTFDGVTRASRTCPSAGGLYPLEVYIVAGKVKSLKEGIYKYIWEDHRIEIMKEGDYRRKLAVAAIGQVWLMAAPASIIITAHYNKTGRVYGDRGIIRYVHMDAGHSAQNIYLQAVSLGLGTVAVGAFINERVKKILDLEKEEPLYIMPVGRLR